ncbi:MAG: chromate resistance protein ChrB domain-containing protein [Pseudomonadota bacterium]
MNLTCWHALIASLPSGHAALRMRLWRTLKGRGAAMLRDGVWLLPESAAAGFDDLSRELQARGGTTERLVFEAHDAAQEARLRALFDRGEDYAGFMRAVKEAHSAGPDLRQLVRLRREFERLAALDFFPGAAQAAAAAALADLERRAMPDEPAARAGKIKRLDAAAYQGRIWATRARPWVDRLASAWLIRRFIDPKARFLWLKRPADCPKKAVGFDFDGASFAHVGQGVTFETLLASFGLEADPALARLASLVHYLDVGGPPVPEAAGVAAVLAGMRDAIDDDDGLLAAAERTFDYLYASFERGESAS